MLWQTFWRTCGRQTKITGVPKSSPEQLTTSVISCALRQMKFLTGDDTGLIKWVHVENQKARFSMLVATPLQTSMEPKSGGSPESGVFW